MRQEIEEQNLGFSSGADMLQHWHDNKDIGAIRKMERDVSSANARNKIVLGYPDRDFEGDPITIDIKQRVCIGISANIAGSGKTVLGGNIIEQLRAKLDCSIVLFDSKPEFQYRIRPQTNPDLLRKLNVIRQDLPYVRPHGWENMVSVAPDFVVNQGFQGTRIRYDTNDMEWPDIQTLFGLREDVQQHARSAIKLNMAIRGIEDEGAYMQGVSDGGAEDRPIGNVQDLLNTFNAGVVKDDVLKKSFLTMMMNRVIGSSTHFDITKPLRQGQMIQYVTRIASDENMKTKVLAYMSIAIREICRAREAYVQPGYQRSKKVLEKPVFLYVTEAQTALPRDPYRPSTKIELNAIYDRFRWLGVGLILDYTGFTKIDINSIKQSDYTIAFKTTGNELRHLQKQLNLSFENEDAIANLKADKNCMPFEAALIRQTSNPQEPVERFFPLPPMSNVQESQRIN
jgi:hypothetical protein